MIRILIDSRSANSDDDDMAELERELEKIKRERKEDQDRKQREREAAEAAQAERDAMMANPLMAQQAEDEADGDFTIRRKWWEETVFRNQAKAEPQYKKRFINDTLRNDFHKRFLNKFIK
jgi:protein CWC15